MNKTSNRMKGRKQKWRNAESRKKSGVFPEPTQTPAGYAVSIGASKERSKHHEKTD